VRHDGFYIIRQYGTKLNSTAETHRMQLTLERIPGQKPLGSVRGIPKPSQLDDWAIFGKIEEEIVKKYVGLNMLLEYKVRREVERIDRENWRRAKLFTTAINREGWKIDFVLSHSPVSLVGGG
jgi:hypothetical protein